MVLGNSSAKETRQRETFLPISVLLLSKHSSKPDTQSPGLARCLKPRTLNSTHNGAKIMDTVASVAPSISQSFCGQKRFCPFII